MSQFNYDSTKNEVLMATSFRMAKNVEIAGDRMKCEFVVKFRKNEKIVKVRSGYMDMYLQNVIIWNV